ncbi:MAG: HEAT repeat domain-containing protein [Holophagales bacterium]|jgi:hypothetical protein|nr:HEAT repeat domain-containing protein [Holophagales bacterium]MBK9967542.1 HEAT repeat domain-containing protein [Holophagales bacterium]
MDCRQVLEIAVARTAGEPAGPWDAEADAHLEGCRSCRSEAAALDEAWERIALPDPEISPGFRERTIGRLEEALARRNVAPFRPRTWWRTALQAAALVVAGAGGFLLARASAPAAETFGGPAAAAPSFAVAAQRQVDVSRVGLDLSGNPRLRNVSFRPTEADGRLAISFDVTTRYHVTGRPEDRAVASLLAYVVNAQSATEGARGRAIDLVSSELGEKAAASPEIVDVLVRTLKEDRNPGVRKKAVEALVQLPPSLAIRDALAFALKSDANPAVRMIAVDGLARAATTLRDPLSIETLRLKAADETEPGFVRVKAASALREIPL